MTTIRIQWHDVKLYLLNFLGVSDEYFDSLDADLFEVDFEG